MNQTPTTALREQTARYWAGFTHARNEQDVARVHAFQALLRTEPDPAKLTDDQVSEAYGGRGWAPAPACAECGGRDDNTVQFGAGSTLALCGGCIAAAAQFIGLLDAARTAESPAEAKPGFFTRLLRKN